MTAVDLAEGMAERNVPKLIKRHVKARWFSINSSQRWGFFCRVSIVKQQINKLITAPKLSSTSTCWYARTHARRLPPAGFFARVGHQRFLSPGLTRRVKLASGRISLIKAKAPVKTGDICVCTSRTGKHKCVFVSFAHFCSTFTVSCDTTWLRRLGGLIPLLGCCSLTTPHHNNNKIRAKRTPIWIIRRRFQGHFHPDSAFSFRLAAIQTHYCSLRNIKPVLLIHLSSLVFTWDWWAIVPKILAGHDIQ